MLKFIFAWFLKFDWKLGALLILILSGLRMWAVFYGISTGDNSYLSMLFLLMILLPWIMLTSAGRKQIEFKKIKLRGVTLSFLLGIGAALVIFGIGFGTYGGTISNWFYYIGSNYPVDLSSISADEKPVYFFIFSAIGMTFSPFGEELFYRGLVHGSIKESLGERIAAIVDSSAFGLVHLSHFGIIWVSGKWQWIVLPSLIWLVFIFLTGLLFNWCKNQFESIWGAVICHMGFNLAMTWVIFYWLF